MSSQFRFVILLVLFASLIGAMHFLDTSGAKLKPTNSLFLQQPSGADPSKNITEKKRVSSSSSSSLSSSSIVSAIAKSKFRKNTKSQRPTTTTAIPTPAPATEEPVLLITHNRSRVWNQDAIAATQQQSFRDGLMWNYTTRRLVPIPGFKAPLLPFETSAMEFTCDPRSVFEQKRREGKAPMWTSTGFLADDVLMSETTHLAPQVKRDRDKNNNNNRAVAGAASGGGGGDGDAETPIRSTRLRLRPGREFFSRWFDAESLANIDSGVLDAYASFQFHTSWHFRGYLPWQPLPMSREQIYSEFMKSKQRQRQQDAAADEPRGDAAMPAPASSSVSSSLLANYATRRPRAARYSHGNMSSSSSSNTNANININNIPVNRAPPQIYRSSQVYLPPPESPIHGSSNNNNNNNNNNMFAYRAWHDISGMHRLYRIENVCIQPYNGGLSFATLAGREKYYGLDDTRSRNHNDAVFSSFLNDHLVASPTKVTHFDRRPVIFMPLLRPFRGNFYHAVTRYLAVIGILNLKPFVAGTPAEFASQRSNHFHSFLPEEQPLIVLVSDVNFNYDGEEVIWSVLFRTLDVPLALVTADPAGRGTQHEKLEADYVRRLSCYHTQGNHSIAHWIVSRAEPKEELLNFSTTNYSAASSSSRSSNNNNDNPKQEKQKQSASTKKLPSSPLTDGTYKKGSDWANVCGPRGRVSSHVKIHVESRICFRRALAWQNCFGGSPMLSSSSLNCMNAPNFNEAEPYSFGNYAPLTPNRQRMLDSYRARVDACLPPPIAATPIHSVAVGALAPPPPPPYYSSPSGIRLPRLFWDVRTLRRRIRLLPMFLQQIEEAVSGKFVEQMSVREVLRGSRSSYLNDIRRADIWLGIHGAAESHIALMQERGVVVEFNVPHMYGSSGAVDADKGKGWFTIFSKARGAHHYVIKTYPSYRFSYFVSPQYLIETIKEASCRWLLRHGQLDFATAEGVLKLERAAAAAETEEEALIRSRFEINRTQIRGAAVAAASSRNNMGGRSSINSSNVNISSNDNNNTGASGGAVIKRRRRSSAHPASASSSTNSNLIPKISLLARACAEFGTARLRRYPVVPIREHSERSFATEACMQILAALLTERGAREPMWDGPTTVSFERCNRIVRQLQGISSLDTGEQFRSQFRLQSQYYFLWQPLVDLFAGDGWQVVNVSGPGASGGSAPVRRYRIVGCMNPNSRRGRGPEGVAGDGENDDGTVRSVPRNPLNTVDLRLAEDPSCLFASPPGWH